MASKRIAQLLGDRADYLLNHECKTIDKSQIHLPSPYHVEEQFVNSNRSNQTLRSLQQLLSHGRLADTGFCSIFPVDQGIEHSAGALSLQIQFILIPRISLNSQSMVVVVELLQLSACLD